MPVKELTALTLTDLLKEYRRGFYNYWEEHDEIVKAFKKRLIEDALDAERSEWICCKPYERSSERQGQRNGYWKRWITLKDGRLEIKTPRLRVKGYESHIIARYKQMVKEVDEALKRIFLYGASTRLTGEALMSILRESISAQTISNIAKSLDEEVKIYHNRKIEDKRLYLFLDGIVLKIKTGFGSKKKAILAAYGIRVKVRTTNVIERAFREAGRRTRPMSCFNNTPSIERIVYAVLSHLNYKWRIKPLKEFTRKS